MNKQGKGNAAVIKAIQLLMKQDPKVRELLKLENVIKDKDRYDLIRLKVLEARTNRNK